MSRPSDRVEYMQISELTRRSGVSVARIKYYIQKGLVPPPLKANKTTGYYANQHLEILKVIKEMRDERKLPISFIKRMIESITGSANNKQECRADPLHMVKSKIIDSSIEVFRRKGVEGATITDLTKAAGIGRRTFYEHFDNKKELFIECLQEIFQKARKEAGEDEDFETEAPKMIKAFHKAYPEWSDMMNLLRAAAVTNPDEFAPRLEEALDFRTEPIIRALKKGMKEGRMRELDAEIVGIILAAVQEYINYYYYRGRFGEKDIFRVFEDVSDFLNPGLIPTFPPDEAGTPRRSRPDPREAAEPSETD